MAGGRATLPFYLDRPEDLGMVECPECKGHGEDQHTDECWLCLGLGAIDNEELELLS